MNCSGGVLALFNHNFSSGDLGDCLTPVIQAYLDCIDANGGLDPGQCQCDDYRDTLRYAVPASSPALDDVLSSTGSGTNCSLRLQVLRAVLS